MSNHRSQYTHCVASGHVIRGGGSGLKRARARRHTRTRPRARARVYVGRTKQGGRLVNVQFLFLFVLFLSPETYMCLFINQLLRNSNDLSSNYVVRAVARGAPRTRLCAMRACAEMRAVRVQVLRALGARRPNLWEARLFYDNNIYNNMTHYYNILL